MSSTFFQREQKKFHRARSPHCSPQVTGLSDLIKRCLSETHSSELCQTTTVAVSMGVGRGALWGLDFENFNQKRLFEWEESNFTAFDHPWKGLGKIPWWPPWKKNSSDAHGSQHEPIEKGKRRKRSWSRPYKNEWAVCQKQHEQLH